VVHRTDHAESNENDWLHSFTVASRVTHAHQYHRLVLSTVVVRLPPATVSCNLQYEFQRRNTAESIQRRCTGQVWSGSYSRMHKLATNKPVEIEPIQLLEACQHGLDVEESIGVRLGRSAKLHMVVPDGNSRLSHCVVESILGVDIRPTNRDRLIHCHSSQPSLIYSDSSAGPISA